jgi:hypothetical protein
MRIILKRLAKNKVPNFGMYAVGSRPGEVTGCS